MHWRAQCHAKWPRRCRRIEHHAGLEPISPDHLRPALTTQPLVHVNCPKKTVYGASYYLNCFALLFWLQNCRSQIAQVEYQGQASNSRILERKPMIDTSYRIRHRLELKYFHFAQFLLNWQCSWSSLSTSEKWELRTWNLGQIFEIQPWMVGQ